MSSDTNNIFGSCRVGSWRMQSGIPLLLPTKWVNSFSVRWVTTSTSIVYANRVYLIIMAVISGTRSFYKKFIAEFIELYKSHPTLWNLKSPEYNDRELKHSAYMKLVDKLREVEPNCNKQDVIKKINSLRSAFRREYRKVVRMTACGKLYKPMLWYYDLILFTANDSDSKLKDVVETERMNSDSGIRETTRESSLEPLTMALIKEEDDSCTSYDVDGSKFMSFGEEESSGPVPPAHTEDEFDAIGRNVAFKLRNMERKQKIIAERIIAETLFQGQMGALKVNTSPTDFIPTLSKDEEDPIFLP